MYQDAVVGFTDLKVMFFVVAAIFVVALIFTLKNWKNKQTRGAYLAGGIGIAVIAGALGAPLEATVRKDYYRDHYAANIVQKYEVDSVDREMSYFIPDENYIVTVVVNVDGEKYEFITEIDLKTSEPTLIDMPIPGGVPIDESVLNAKDLLRK